ncbi:MAG: YhbY family RNA-binding protein [Candidatus Hodarchaeales archaeon]
MKKAELQKVRTESASLQVGKNGITETFISELNDRLKQIDMIKIKFLKNCPYNNRKEAFSALELKIKGKFSVLETRGWTIIVKKSN